MHAHTTMTTRTNEDEPRKMGEIRRRMCQGRRDRIWIRMPQREGRTRQTNALHSAKERCRVMGGGAGRVKGSRDDLRDLVQASTSTVGDKRREFPNRASSLRRRIVRFSAPRQMLAGPRRGECHVKGKWPADHDHPSRSADRVLAAFAARLRRDFGEVAQGVASPKDIILKAGDAVANLEPEGLPDEGKAFSKGVMAADFGGDMQRECEKLQKGGWGGGIRWMSEERVDALGDIVQRWLLGPAEPLPAAWAHARAVFLPKSRSVDIEAHRPVAPSEPLQGWVSRVLMEQADGMQPKWLAAEGFVKGGWASARILTALLLVEKIAERGNKYGT